MKDRQLKNNSMLIDGCFMNSWFHQFKIASRDYFNPVDRQLPEQMFKQDEDKALLNQIK